MQEHKLKHIGTEFDGLLHWAEGSVPFHFEDFEASHVSMLMLTDLCPPAFPSVHAL